MEFRKATAADIDAVAAIYTAFLTYEQQNGACTAWKLGVYPTKETARRGLESSALYVLEENGSIVATVLLHKEQPKEYASVPWRHAARKDLVLVIHTLCVSPSQKGKGLGKTLVGHAIEEAKRLGCTVVRLDTGAQNKPAIGLYRKMGFGIVSTGTMVLDGLIAHDKHVFMEYVL